MSVDGHVAIIRFECEQYHFSGRTKFAEELRELNIDATCIVLDLEIVHIMESGIKAAIVSYWKAKNHRLKFRIARPQSHVWNTLKILKLDTILPIYSDLREAVSATWE